MWCVCVCVWKALKLPRWCQVCQNPDCSSILIAAVVVVIYNLASVLSRGASFCVSIMLPAIFSLPFMNAACGFSLPRAMSTISSSATVRVVSTLTPASAGPAYALAALQSRAVRSKRERD